eukprot:CAMPEP_0173096504 /NCGR_PEP_ID=MMETSP1102-20130122/32995_1 /TAXON_ID=49646 /ORGANISM="Geminigera sp., Strain Caron Lab Isolate" /LENGTH=259 /DNA_ID=CAMNT_0013987463 /DNA_START=131 /DNA_END=907 /DNA_ORIENTATION=+
MDTCLGGGKFRWIAKPFKRWAFAKGEEYTRIHSTHYADKYLLKFLRKHGKEADKMNDIPTQSLIKCTDEKHLVPKLIGIIVARKKKSSPKTVLAELEAAMHTSICSGHASKNHTNAQENEWVEKFAEYSCGLGEALDKNRGLDHSKVREYWLSRGPRLFLTAVLYFAFCIVCLETLKGGVRSHSDRMYTLATNSGALVIAFWLLYKRLGDAVEGVIARAAHDYYVNQKKMKFLDPTSPVHMRKLEGNGGEQEKEKYLWG